MFKKLTGICVSFHKVSLCRTSVIPTFQEAGNLPSIFDEIGDFWPGKINKLELNTLSIYRDSFIHSLRTERGNLTLNATAFNH